MNNTVIDGPVTDFPAYGQTTKQEQQIKELYQSTFDIAPPASASYLDIRFALDLDEPIAG